MSRTGATLHYAGFWRRVAASLIDSVLLLLILYPPLYALYGKAYFQWARYSDSFAVYGWGDLLLNYILPLVLVTILLVRYGATPGKKALGCRVVDAVSGAPLRPGQAVIRYLGYYLSLLPLGLGFLWIAWDRRKQGFHYKLAGTVVLYLPHDESAKSLDTLLKELR